ncbi:MAG: hypothetical protein C0504_08205 [Candidatus Solibacter sp.]|nr:hypothetical protein [Candidatus Solibacter sp.]
MWYNGKVRLTFSGDHSLSTATASRIQKDNLLQKLQALDSKARRKGLAGLNASKSQLVALGMECDSGGNATKNSYGVFHLAWLAAKNPQWPAVIQREVEEVKQAIRDTHKSRLRFVIWAGMGGSAEDKSAYVAAGLLNKGPKLFVLDSTDPAKLKAILAHIEAKAGSLAEGLKSTLVVGMAMGMTSFEPVVNLEKLATLYGKLAIDSRPNFIYMTLPGSILDRFAGPRGYRKIELQLDGGNSTGGRHSSPLTKGSLIPLALAGVDLKRWFEGACLTPAQVDTAFQLAAFLHAHGAAGRDKVTLLASKPLSAAALWTKQDFEESLGKSEEIGIKIVINETPRLANCRQARDSRQDRVFLAVERSCEAGVDKQKLQLLKRSGYPVARLVLDKDAPLSAFMQFIHYTVFGLGWLRKMNFVTQPGVELYKAITQPIYEYGRVLGGTEKTAEWKALKTAVRQAKWRGLTLYYDKLRIAVEPDGRDAPGIYAAILTQLAASGAVEYGELTFFGDTRYDKRGQAVRKVLDKAGEKVFRSAMKMPVDIYEGPAMNHSYHEMVIGHGRCLSTVLMSEKAETLPAAGYKADYHQAQFLATQMALEQRARPVVSMLMKDLSPASIENLGLFFNEVSKRLKR